MKKLAKTALLGSLIAGTVACSQQEAKQEKPFEAKSMEQGYQNGEKAETVNNATTAPTDAKTAEGKCGEGKCGEGKCGGDKATTADGKTAEGKCGGDKATTDSKAGEGKCGEGKCGGDKATAGADGKAGEGKCGEGKCGGSADGKTATPAPEAKTETTTEAKTNSK